MPPVGEGRFGPGRLAFAVLLVAVAFLSLRPVTDFDYGWHVANGRHLGDGILLGGRDVYSWTAKGSLWVAHEWTTEVGMAIVHDRIGAAGNSLLAAVIVALAIGLVGRRVRRRGAGWVGTLLTCGLVFAATLVSIGVRPQVLELLYLAALLLWIDLGVERRLRPAVFLGGVAAGALVWANSHGSFPLLPGVLAVAAVAAAVERHERWRVLAAAAVIGAAIPLINPWGLNLYAFAVQSLSSSTTQVLIEEWRPPRLAEPSFVPFTVELVLAAVAAVLALRVRVARRAPGSVRLDDIAVALAIGVLGLQSGRHVMLFGIAAAPLLAFALGEIRRPLARRMPSRPSAARTMDPRMRDAVNGAAFLAIAATLFAVGWSLVGPEAQQRALERRYPVGLVDDIDTAVRTPGRRLLNEYTWGGFLLLHRPDVEVFIDGRSEVYGDAQLARYASIVKLEPGWQQVVQTLGANVALLPTQSALAEALRDAGWRERAADSVGVILVAP